MGADAEPRLRGVGGRLPRARPGTARRRGSLGRAGRGRERAAAWPQRPLAASGALARSGQVPAPVPRAPKRPPLGPRQSPPSIYLKGDSRCPLPSHTPLQRGWTFLLLRFYLFSQRVVPKCRIPHSSVNPVLTGPYFKLRQWRICLKAPLFCAEFKVLKAQIHLLPCTNPVTNR